MTTTHDELMAADHAEEATREWRLEELYRGHIPCLCGKYHEPEGVHYCNICGEAACPDTLKPAGDPVNGVQYDHVCEVCCQNIETIKAATDLYARRDEITEFIETGLSMAENPDFLMDEQRGHAIGVLKGLQEVYGFRKVG